MLVGSSPLREATSSGVAPVGLPQFEQGEQRAFIFGEIVGELEAAGAVHAQRFFEQVERLLALLHQTRIVERTQRPAETPSADVRQQRRLSFHLPGRLPLIPDRSPLSTPGAGG